MGVPQGYFTLPRLLDLQPQLPRGKRVRPTVRSKSAVPFGYIKQRAVIAPSNSHFLLGSNGTGKAKPLQISAHIRPTRRQPRNRSVSCAAYSRRRGAAHIFYADDSAGTKPASQLRTARKHKKRGGAPWGVKTISDGKPYRVGRRKSAGAARHSARALCRRLHSPPYSAPCGTGGGN